MATKKKSKPTIASLQRKLRAAEIALGKLAEVQDKVPEYDDIMRLARRWHYTEVRSLADEAIKELVRERAKTPMTDTEARDWLTEWVDQTTDGHQHVIYTGQAALLLAASDNEDAYAESMGDDSVTAADTSVRACAALRADVWELLEARSTDWDRDDPDPCPNPDCPTHMDSTACHMDGACPNLPDT